MLLRRANSIAVTFVQRHQTPVRLATGQKLHIEAGQVLVRERVKGEPTQIERYSITDTLHRNGGSFCHEQVAGLCWTDMCNAAL